MVLDHALERTGQEFAGAVIDVYGERWPQVSATLAAHTPDDVELTFRDDGRVSRADLLSPAPPSEAALECVAEQHETVNAVERADQLIEYPFAPQNIGTRPITDVQIGDDERACQSARS